MLLIVDVVGSVELGKTMVKLDDCVGVCGLRKIPIAMCFSKNAETERITRPSFSCWRRSCRAVSTGSYSIDHRTRNKQQPIECNCGMCLL